MNFFRFFLPWKYNYHLFYASFPHCDNLLCDAQAACAVSYGESNALRVPNMLSSALSRESRSSATFAICNRQSYTFLNSQFSHFSIQRSDSLYYLYRRKSMSARPTFVDEELLKRPLPELVPPKLSPTQNPPYAEGIRNKIAELKCHPLIESAVGLDLSYYAG